MFFSQAQTGTNLNDQVSAKSAMVFDSQKLWRVFATDLLHIRFHHPWDMTVDLTSHKLMLMDLTGSNEGEVK